LTISSTENESPTEENSEKLLIVRHKINKKKKDWLQILSLIEGKLKMQKKFKY